MARSTLVLMMTLTLALMATAAQAAPNGKGADNGHRVAAFVDENGDGFNDLAPDADGDGIPNGLDDDFVRPQNGSGPGFGGQVTPEGQNAQGPRWMTSFAFSRYVFFGGFGPFDLQSSGNRGHGPADGSGFGGNGPADGSGFGPGTGTGTGDCDDTGPNGQQGSSKDRGNRR